MIKETLEKALIAMDHALAPKNTEGLIEPIEFFNELPKEMVVPYFDPMANGGLDRPMCFADEFVDGKLPADLTYVTGYTKPVESLSYNVCFENHTYSNPEYGLSGQDRLALLAGRELLTEQAPASKVQQVKPNKNISSENEDDSMLPGDMDIYDSPLGMYVLSKRGQKISICNFYIQVTHHRHVHLTPHATQDEYQLTVHCGQLSKTILVPVHELDNLIKRIQRAIPSCTVSASFTKISQSIINHVRKNLPKAPTYEVFRYTGFVRVGEQWIYAQDAADPPNDKVIFDTGRSISCNPGIFPVAAFWQAMDFLSITPRSELIVPLFLYAHLGPLFELFNAAGYAPKFVPFLNGRTGSLKTSLSICLFHLFDQQSNGPEASFRDTAVALELKLGAANSHVLLIDDFQPAVTSTAGKQNLEKLEAVIRFVGDSIGKARGGPELELRTTASPTGCCLITGEDTGGSQSSLLRCLVLSIAKGDIDGDKLKVFQKHPEILQAHMYHFLTSGGTNASVIIDLIRNKFTDFRDMFRVVTHEARLADTGAILLLVACILLDYAINIHAVTPADYDQHLALFTDSIKAALIYSENYSKEMNPTAMYLRALFDLTEKGALLLAESSATYNPSKHIGYIHPEGSWWLRNRDIFPKILSYWQALNINFPLREEKILESLADTALIELDHENRDGKHKRLFCRRSSIEGRPRMMVLRTQQCREYLANELGEF